MKDLRMAVVLMVVLLQSCANTHRGSEFRMCSSSPADTLKMFFQGIADGIFGVSKVRAMTKNDSITGTFGNGDEARGIEIIRQIAANPKFVEKGGSCECYLLSVTDTDRPENKLAKVHRTVADDDAIRYYTRVFIVHFDLDGNCIVTVDSSETKWELIKTELTLRKPARRSLAGFLFGGP